MPLLSSANAEAIYLCMWIIFCFILSVYWKHDYQGQSSRLWDALYMAF